MDDLNLIPSTAEPNVTVKVEKVEYGMPAEPTCPHLRTGPYCGHPFSQSGRPCPGSAACLVVADTNALREISYYLRSQNRTTL